jgi:hypothetical protein
MHTIDQVLQRTHAGNMRVFSGAENEGKCARVRTEYGVCLGVCVEYSCAIERYRHARRQVCWHALESRLMNVYENPYQTNT